MFRELTDIRKDLADLKRQARANERIWSGFRRIEIDAIGAKTFQQLVHNVVLSIRETFKKVDSVSIACVNIDYEIVRILDQCDTPYDVDEYFVLLSDGELSQWFSGSFKPILGTCDTKIRKRLFAHCKKPIRSVALSPLVAAGRMIGFLAQGSENPHHFSVDAGTDLLEHLSATIALCIRNTVNIARLERHGLTDPLTDIPNRRFLERRLSEEVERCRRYGHPLSCVMLDIDYFKSVNDRYGHSIGDQVLKAVAGALSKGLRVSDILSRYGGEEFVLLLPETGLRHGVRIARRHHREIGMLRLQTPDGERLRISVSAGVAVLDHPSRTADKGLGQWLLEQSDEALYRAKRQGRNQVISAESKH